MVYPFYTLTNLQGSQTSVFIFHFGTCFTLLQTYKVLKRVLATTASPTCFTLLQTYKVLKHIFIGQVIRFCFTLLQTYKVLKPQMRLSPNPNILVICVRYLVMYKTQIFIYQLIIFTFQTFTLVCLN